MSERSKLDRNLSGDAFRAWYWLKSNAGKTYKKSQPGSHKFEDSDLTNSIIK